MTTRHGTQPLPPATLAAFKARLGIVPATQAETEVADLDHRADVAAGIVTTALADGNADLAARAFARMTERWDQREALIAAPRLLWVRRYEQVEQIVQAAPKGSAVLDAVWWSWYYTADRAAGRKHNLAAGYADQRVDNAQALAQRKAGSR